MSTIHERIGEDVESRRKRMWVECKCGHTEELEPGDFGYYLANGWPEHCGETMILKEEKDER